MLDYNGKWKIPRQGDFLGYSFIGINPIRFEIPWECNIETLPHRIQESQVVR